MSALRAALYQAADLIADAIEKHGAADWIDQDASPIGKRRHLAAVRSGKLQGHKEGRRVLVRRSDLDAYIAKHRVRLVETEEAEVKRDVAKLLTMYTGSRRRSA